MIKTKHGIYDGDSWEEYCQLLLKVKYEKDGYQEMPAHFKGDLGIEGFTRDGVVFQCYCPDEEYDPKVLYEHQRDKITKDLGKLMKNKIELKRHMGRIKIQKWIFLTPLYNNKELMAHCQNKITEYRKLAQTVDHLELDIDIFVQDEGFFVKEIPLVKGYLRDKISVNVVLDNHDVIDWKGGNSQIISVIHGKLGTLFKGFEDPEHNTNKLTDKVIKDYIKGQKILREMERTHQVLYEKYLRIKNSTEEELEFERLMSDDIPSLYFKKSIQNYKTILSSELGTSLDYVLIEELTQESRADWLARCPLNFGGM